MSARMMRKLQNSATGQVEQTDFQEVSDEEDELDTSGTKSHLNPFDLLNQQSLSESEFKEDDNETEHINPNNGSSNTNAAVKKKKRKRKKKSKSSGNHISSEDNEKSEKYFENLDPLLDKVLDAVPRQSEKQLPRSMAVGDTELLTVELKHLNPQNEMRRTFGKRVVKVEHKRGRQKLSLKSTHMVTGKESWPALTKNIIVMKPLPAPERQDNESDDTNVQWFGFEHSQYYQNVQNMFLTALERTDSDFLINLIRRCPYHVDSLIQLSELCKITEDYALASELIERALLVLESSLHINFSLSSGNCRLDYRRQENRAFFIVLFKHAQYLEARACSRTAFEISKLILSLQPDSDPLAIILIIDYYAMRSRQYQWLVNFYEKYNSVRNLSQLPNMAYTYALALHALHGTCEKSNNALQYALLMFPGLLKPLLEELSVQTDKRVLASTYFNSEVSGSQSPALHQLICLYICRAKVIWRQGDVLNWLEQSVNCALDRIEQNDEVIADYKKKRSVRYSSPPRAILRHVILSDYKEKVPLAIFVAKERQAIMAYDPLPPKDSINCYERKTASSSSQTSGSNRSVSMFFQSFWPSFNINQMGVAAGEAANAVGADGAALPNEADEVHAHLQALNANLDLAADQVAQGNNEAAAGTYRDLTQSLTSLVDVIHDFLQNFRTSEHSQDSDDASSDGALEPL